MGSTLFLGFTIVLLSLLASPGRAQQSDLSQQMQIFNTLPTDQQQALLQRLGGSGATGLGGGIGTSAVTGGYNSSQAALIRQQLLQQQRRAQELQNENSLDQFGMPLIKPGDTVLVDVALPREQDSTGAGDNANFNGNNNNNQPNNGQFYPQNVYPNGTLPNQAELAQLAQQQAANNQRLQERPQQSAEVLQAEEKQQLTDLIDRGARDAPGGRRARTDQAARPAHASAAAEIGARGTQALRL
jgi:hypothetical protein